MKTKRKATAVAFCGMATAVIVVLMFIAGVIDVLDYTVSAVCSLIITFMIIEFGNAEAVSVYFASSILALIVIPSKISALLYVAFCGWYPFAKKLIERLPRKISFVVKLLVFNSVLGIIFFVAKKLFLLENISTVYFLALFFLSNFTFVIYDKLITKLIWLYVNKYRSKLKFLHK